MVFDIIYEKILTIDLFKRNSLEFDEHQNIIDTP